MKCSVCKSQKITKQVIDNFYQISCARCGYVNRREATKELMTYIHNQNQREKELATKREARKKAKLESKTTHQ